MWTQDLIYKALQEFMSKGGWRNPKLPIDGVWTAQDSADWKHMMESFCSVPPHLAHEMVTKLEQLHSRITSHALWAGIKNKIEAELGMTPKSVVAPVAKPVVPPVAKPVVPPVAKPVVPPVAKPVAPPVVQPASPITPNKAAEPTMTFKVDQGTDQKDEEEQESKEG